MPDCDRLNRIFQLFPSLRDPVRLAAAAACLMGAGCAHHVTVRELPAPLLDPTAELARARSHHERIARGSGSPSDIRAYNESLGRLIQHADLNDGSLTVGDLTLPLDDRLESPAVELHPERIRPADSLLIRGFRERVVVDGVGAPVVLQFPAEGYTSEKGRFQPATAILEFDGPEATPRIILHDTLVQTEAVVNGASPQTLRADYTAPLACRFAAEDRQRINVPAMLLFDKYASNLGMSRVDATYPGKIPVVFVHGLKSTPITWRNVMNELRSDPLVRERYEFWTFGYGTGAPIPFSAMKLREALQGMVTYRKHLGAETPDVVLIGHSMGGLLSRLMTERSGDELWFQLFKCPVDELPLSERDREILRRMAYFEPLPFVRRVTFVATPHGGSQIADNAIGQISSRLIKLPSQLLKLSASVIRAPISLLTPEGMKVATRPPTSIKQLESQSDLLQRLKAHPLNPAVSFHSIVGDRGLGNTFGEISDGVVPYTSAHIEGARSEIIVPAGHNAHLHPDAIAELSRILREHVAGR